MVQIKDFDRFHTIFFDALHATTFPRNKDIIMFRSLLGRRSTTNEPLGTVNHGGSDFPQEMTEGPSRTLSLPPERVCFICLDDNNADEDRLLPCCTRCCARVHQSCWMNWRSSQTSHARRARVSGIWSGSDPFMCSICKSGAARLEDEIVSSRWLESFSNVNRSGYTNNRNSSGLFLALSRPPSDSDNEEDGDDDIHDVFSLLRTERHGRKRIRTLPFVALIVTIFFIFGQVVVWRVMDIDSQFLVFSVTITICSALGVFSSICLHKYQQIKYNNFSTV